MTEEANGIDKYRQEIEVMKSGMIESIQGIADLSVLNNVAIFVDYDNVYHTLMGTYRHDPDHPEEDKNLFLKLWDRYGSDHIRTFRAYADFEQIRAQLTSLQRKRVQIRHVYANGRKNDGRKNSSDIEMCIDAIESTYKDKNISCYVFVTADSDMIPIMSRMMFKGKHVHLYYMSTAARSDLSTYAHEAYDLKDFLNIEDVVYNLDDYVIPALGEVQVWNERNKTSQHWLGSSMLKKNVSTNLMLPEVKSSELIDTLKAQELISETMKNGKASVVLTAAGEALLVGDSLEVAPVAAAKQR